MPPALSDSEASDASDVESVATPPPVKRDRKSSSADANETSDSGQAKKRGRPKGTGKTNGSPVTSVPASKRASDPIESSKEDEDEDGEEDEEDEEDEEEEEYEVQEIIEHILDKKSGEPRFHVIWKGYPDPSDFTWEPEENLAENASDILNEYIAKIGGREKLFGKPTKGKKRGRQSSAAAATTAVAKRPRKSEEHPSDRETPTKSADKPFKPPAGSWEDHVTNVEMFRDANGALIVCLSWIGGEKTQHSAQQTYMRCPQKILQFYESHISFRTDA